MNTSDADHDLKSALRQHFGFPEFRPGQQVALEYVLAGRDTLVVMPTGSGKSLIYQLAALLLPGITLVISPLIALMKDQTDSLVRRNISATFINSTLSAAEQARRLQGVARGDYKLVFVAPERLRSGAFLKALHHLRIRLLAVDEAHCLSQWGHDFRPDYLHIADARRQFNAPVTLALTATATLRVQDDITRLLNLSSPQRLVTGFNRPNLTFEVFSAPDPAAKLNHVRDFLADVEGAGIIYTGTRRDAEEVAEFVREVAGLETRHYHGALDPATRARVQDAFLAGDVPVIVATNAFGMGIDRPDVRFVLHYTMPGTLEAYYQEAGRAGRDGLPARAVLLYSPKDTSLQEFFIENDSPTAADLRAVHNFIQNLSPPLTAALSPTEEGPGAGAEWGPRISFKDIELATGLPETKVRVALDQLEAAGVLRRAPDEAFGVLRAEALPLSDSALQSIAAQVASRRKLKRQQLAKIVDYAETNACRRRTILDHFGDTGPADAPICCDNCLSRAEPVEAEFRPAQSQSERAGLIVLDAVARLKWEIGKGKLAQILKGSSAKGVKAYAQARNYGKFASLRLSEIEGVIAQLIGSGYLKSVVKQIGDSDRHSRPGSSVPILKLTPRGETALQSRAAIQVDLRPVKAGGARNLKAKREARVTVALTGQELARGLTPEQIAAERGLAVGTIYSHLATLIADGQVSLDSVVPADTQKKIHVAIEKVGSADYLAPIKALLPEGISYGMIRCVVNARLREHGAPPSTGETPAGKDLAGQVHAWGESTSLEHVPALVLALSDSNGNVRRLAASALGKLEAVAAVEPLLALLEREPSPQVRQYAIKALGKIGDGNAREILERISGDPAEMEYNRVAAKAALTNLVRVPPAPDGSSTVVGRGAGGEDPIAAFLSRPHPRPLKGPWLAGWALDFHSRFDGGDQVRSEVGDLLFRYKYREEHTLAQELARRLADFLHQRPELPVVDAVIPVPPSTERAFDPVTELGRELAEQLGSPVLLGVLVKTRATRLQKESRSVAQKQANVAGAFAVNGDVRGKRLLVLDDLFDSGATLIEATRVLTRAGAASLIVLTLTKTIHADG